MEELAEAVSGRRLETGLGDWQVTIRDIQKGKIELVLLQGSSEKQVRIRFDSDVWNENRIWGVDWDLFADWLLPQVAFRVEELIDQEVIGLTLDRNGFKPFEER